MMVKVELERADHVTGSSEGVTIALAHEGEGTLALMFPVRDEDKLRLCDELTEAIQEVRRAALQRWARG